MRTVFTAIGAGVVVMLIGSVLGLIVALIGGDETDD